MEGLPGLRLSHVDKKMTRIRRHHNNKGYQQIKSGRTRKDAERLNAKYAYRAKPIVKMPQKGVNLMKCRFIFHHGKDSFVGKAITAWTGFLALWYNWGALKYGFSHIEIWLADKYGDFNVCNAIKCPDGCANCGFEPYIGECFSSTTRGDAEGVRFAPASKVLKHPERWSYIEVDVPVDRFEVAYDEMKRKVGAKYDYAGLFGFLQPLPIEDNKKFFCSEICMLMAFLMKVVSKRHKRISPRRAALVLAKIYGEPVAL